MAGDPSPCKAASPRLHAQGAEQLSRPSALPSVRSRLRQGAHCPGTSVEVGNRELADTVTAPLHGLSLLGLGWLTFFSQGQNSVFRTWATYGGQVAEEGGSIIARVTPMAKSLS